MATEARARPRRPLSRRPGAARAVVTALAAAVAAAPLTACENTTGSSRSSTSSSSGRSVVVISAGDDVCWRVTVDGRERKGCGDAEFTDRSGTTTATVLKTTDGSRVRIKLVVDGRTVDSGSVKGRMHYVSVESSSDG
jgi:hypothetical protein